jgi:hypothetical protein
MSDTPLTRPERYAHKAGVMRDQCRVCRHRVDTGYQIEGNTQWDCDINLRPPRRRICPGFWLDEEAV